MTEESPTQRRKREERLGEARAYARSKAGARARLEKEEEESLLSHFFPKDHEQDKEKIKKVLGSKRSMQEIVKLKNEIIPWQESKLKEKLRKYDRGKRPSFKKLLEEL